jgi:tetratricopeptide (TPR) repeat protein
MYIRRDYSQSFFSDRRRRRGRGYWVFVITFLLMMVGFLYFVDSNFHRLQVMALSAVGQGPEPTPFASTYADQGYAAFLRGDVASAADLFGQAVAQQPTNVDYLYEYGRMLIENARYPEAIAVGDTAIQSSPRDPRGYAIKARALDLNGESEAAIPIGQQGFQLNPNFAPVLAALASAYRNIDRYDVALEYAENAVIADPMDATARRVYALSLIWVGRRDEAIDQLSEAIAINPNLTAPYFELAGQYRGANDFEMVVATYEAVLAINPQDPKGNLRLCQVYIQVGQDNRAQGYCEDALAYDPDYAEAESTLGWVMYRRRNYEGAISMFQECEANMTRTGETVNEDTIRCYYMRGLAHYYLGQCNEAWDLFQRSLPLLSFLPQYAADTINGQIEIGMQGVTNNCSGYAGRQLPTAIPPTAIPPTPIGG